MPRPWSGFAIRFSSGVNPNLQPGLPKRRPLWLRKMKKRPQVQLLQQPLQQEQAQQQKEERNLEEQLVEQMRRSLLPQQLIRRSE